MKILRADRPGCLARGCELVGFAWHVRNRRRSRCLPCVCCCLRGIRRVAMSSIGAWRSVRCRGCCRQPGRGDGGAPDGSRRKQGSPCGTGPLDAVPGLYPSMCVRALRVVERLCLRVRMQVPSHVLPVLRISSTQLSPLLRVGRNRSALPPKGCAGFL